MLNAFANFVARCGTHLLLPPVAGFSMPRHFKRRPPLRANSAGWVVAAADCLAQCCYLLLFLQAGSSSYLKVRALSIREGLLVIAHRAGNPLRIGANGVGISLPGWKCIDGSIENGYPGWEFQSPHPFDHGRDQTVG